MNSNAFSWFNEGALKGKFIPGVIITTSKPESRQWEVLSVESERNEQTKDAEIHPSMASIRMKCHSKDNKKTSGIMRIYIQVPVKNTILDTPDERAKQAQPFEPPELTAYRKIAKDPVVSQFTPALLGWKQDIQDCEGHIPGGFSTIIVWQDVPGIRLSGHPETRGERFMFWTLEKEERARIRVKFEETFQLLADLKVLPIGCSINNLVWDGKEEVLYWVGFRKSTRKRTVEWSKAWVAGFDLAKSDDCDWSNDDWDGDTSEWIF